MPVTHVSGHSSRSFRQLKRLILGLSVIGAIGYWSYSMNNTDTVMAPDAFDKQAPDFFIQNSTITEFNEKGHLSSVLIAKEISHYPHNSMTILSYPDMWTYKEDGSNPWQTTADRGRILPDGTTLELSDNVVITQIDEMGKPAQRVDTEFLTVYSAQDYADTSKPVRLTNPTNVVNAVGMRAYYQRDFIQLKSRVNSIHESR